MNEEEIEKKVKPLRKKLYSTWSNMHSRCYNKNHASYRFYGERGISVCKRWHTFVNFFNDVAPLYKEGLTLDRIDSNKNYHPSNFRWATWRQQNNNKRDNHIRRPCTLCKQIIKLRTEGKTLEKIGEIIKRHLVTVSYHLKDHPNYLDPRYSLLSKEERRKIRIRRCLLCQKQLLYEHGRSIYCGNARRKEGCSYKAKIQRDNKWHTKVKYWTREGRKKKLREYYKSYYQRQKLTHPTS